MMNAADKLATGLPSKAKRPGGCTNCMPSMKKNMALMLKKQRTRGTVSLGHIHFSGRRYLCLCGMEQYEHVCKWKGKALMRCSHVQGLKELAGWSRFCCGHSRRCTQVEDGSELTVFLSSPPVHALTQGSLVSAFFTHWNGPCYCHHSLFHVAINLQQCWQLFTLSYVETVLESHTTNCPGIFPTCWWLLFLMFLWYVIFSPLVNIDGPQSQILGLLS